MKIKSILIIVVSLILLGCGGSSSGSVSAGQREYWTEISRQSGSSFSDGSIITYQDSVGRMIVVVTNGNGISIAQIK